jgi:dihydroneopterin aldolase
VGTAPRRRAPRSRIGAVDAFLRDLADALDYATVVKRLLALAADRRTADERFAQAIADVLMGEFGAPWVKVRVAKLAPIAGVKELGIAIERKRG